MNVALRSISLFAGGGGLDLGLEASGVVTVCRVEHEAYAAAVLAARSEDGALDPAPVWSDVSTFDGRPWRGRVDLIAGGFPCQDISHAGKQAGIEGERSGLWKEFLRIIREVGPRYVFVENVSALLVRGLDVVLGDLASSGFDAEWECFRASDVGAPHRRERVFILAHAQSGGCRVGRDAVEPERGRHLDCRGVDLAHSGVERLQGFERHRPAPWTTHGSDPDVAHAQDRGRGERGERERGDLDGLRLPWPPGPEQEGAWNLYANQWPGTEPALRRGADGLAYRAQRLRLLGNGVVPDCAALAFRTLWERAHA